MPHVHRRTRESKWSCVVLFKPCNISENFVVHGPFSTVHRLHHSSAVPAGQRSKGRGRPDTGNGALAACSILAVQYGRSDVGLWRNFSTDLYAELYCCWSLSSL